jgi:hypothetical protein
MTGIPLETAADAFRRFFPDDWTDHLRAWIATRGLSDSLLPPAPAPGEVLRVRPEVP